MHEFKDLLDKYTVGTATPLTKAGCVLDGVGADAEIITNEKGGKQSKSPMAMHLLDPMYLHSVFKELSEQFETSNETNCCTAIQHITDYMRTDCRLSLIFAMDDLCEDVLQQVVRIAKVLQYGAKRYEPNNWRLIPEEEHINHALIHILAHLMGDTQDEHIDHALCRLMMAYATERSDGFEYGAYVENEFSL